MMDSGAGCANRKTDLSNFQTKTTKNPMRCVLANGREIQNRGIIEVKAEIDDETHIIPFEDLPVECPIISVKSIVKKTALSRSAMVEATSSIRSRERS